MSKGELKQLVEDQQIYMEEKFKKLMQNIANLGTGIEHVEQQPPAQWPLTAIIFYFDHQLLGNKMSFALCSIHILLISNEFHKFWMSWDCRRLYAKNE